MTRDELLARFPNASAQFIAANTGDASHHRASPAQPQPTPGNGSLAAPKAQNRDTAFYTVRVTSFRRRLLDTDNLIPKWHVDALRYAGILLSDAPDRCQIFTTQQQVKAKKDERTEIEITKTQ